MPKLAATSVHVLEGRATLYKRANSPLWQVRYKASNRKCRASTHEIDLEKAKQVAVDIVTNAWFREKNDLPVVTKKFKAVAELAIKRMDEVPEGVRGKKTYTSYKLALQNYFIPYLGKYNIDKIDQVVLEKFSLWRTEKNKRQLKATTINTHNSALNRVFDEAVLRGYLTKQQIPSIASVGTKAERRPDITEQEWKQLYEGMRPWVKAARKGNETLLRNLLQNYVLILGNTGIRPGTEAMNLKWNSLSFVEHNGETYLSMSVEGKTGKRQIQVRHIVVEYLQRIQNLDSEISKLSFEELVAAKIDKFIFRVNGKDKTSTYGRMFAKLLESLNLLVDSRSEQPRTLYSIRHYYATRALTRTDITPYQLAEQMGTSVAMITKHYGHLDLLNIAEKFAGAGSVHDVINRTTAKDLKTKKNV